MTQMVLQGPFSWRAKAVCIRTVAICVLYSTTWVLTSFLWQNWMLLTHLAFLVLENLLTNAFLNSRPGTFGSFIFGIFLLCKCTLRYEVLVWYSKRAHQLHHYGDVGQYGAPLACESSVSRFEPGTSHKNAVGLNQRFTLLSIERTLHATPQ